MQDMTKNPYKIGKQSNSARFLLLVILLVSTLYYIHKNNSATTNIAKTKYKKTNAPLDISAVVGKQNGECSAIQPSKDQRPKEEWRKPLWFVALHHSFDDKTHRELIKNLTLLASGGKSFYSSVKGKLRHCIGDTETASCSIGALPTKNFNAYSNKYIMVLRNPTTVLPYSANMKSVKYHSLEGQMTVDFWKETRDGWLEKMMEEWVQQIQDWRKDTNFEVGYYIVYEDLMDPSKGPNVLRQMAKLFRDIGYDTVEDAKIACAWLLSMGEENIQQFHTKGYEFNDYMPGYTKEQKEYILQKMNDLVKEIGNNDPRLTSILENYIKDIEVNTVIEYK